MILYRFSLKDRYVYFPSDVIHTFLKSSKVPKAHKKFILGILDKENFFEIDEYVFEKIKDKTFRTKKLRESDKHLLKTEGFFDDKPFISILSSKKLIASLALFIGPAYTHYMTGMNHYAFHYYGKNYTDENMNEKIYDAFLYTIADTNYEIPIEGYTIGDVPKFDINHSNFTKNKNIM